MFFVPWAFDHRQYGFDRMKLPCVRGKHIGDEKNPRHKQRVVATNCAPAERSGMTIVA